MGIKKEKNFKLKISKLCKKNHNRKFWKSKKSGNHLDSRGMDMKQTRPEKKLLYYSQNTVLYCREYRKLQEESTIH